MRFAPQRLRLAPVRRADLEPGRSWSGFQASLDPGELRGDGQWTDQRWELFAYVRTGRVRRRRARFALDDPALVRAVELPGTDEALVRAVTTLDGAVRLEVRTRWVRVDRHRVLEGGRLELTGVARLGEVADPAGVVRQGAAAEPALELTRTGDRHTLTFPLAIAADGAFSVRLPLWELRSAPNEARREGRDAGEWELSATGGRPVVLAGGLDGAAWRWASRDMSLVRTASGGARLVERALEAVPGVPAVAAVAPDTGRAVAPAS